MHAEELRQGQKQRPKQADCAGYRCGPRKKKKRVPLRERTGELKMDISVVERHRRLTAGRAQYGLTRKRGRDGGGGKIAPRRTRDPEPARAIGLC